MSIKQKFNIVNVVKLKSGSVAMTITHIDLDDKNNLTGYVFWKWFSEGKITEHLLHQDTLKKVS